MSLKFRKLKLRVNETDRGFYSALELRDHGIEFPVKQVYFAQDYKKPTVGGHCHKIQEEVFIMVKGKCVAIIDYGNGMEEIPFSFPGEAMHVGNYVWHAFKDFSSDAILFALSSTNYKPDRSDYVEDYDEYLRVRGKF